MLWQSTFKVKKKQPRHIRYKLSLETKGAVFRFYPKAESCCNMFSSWLIKERPEVGRAEVLENEMDLI